jgi:hypothetical protein
MCARPTTIHSIQPAGAPPAVASWFDEIGDDSGAWLFYSFPGMNQETILADAGCDLPRRSTDHYKTQQEA